MKSNIADKTWMEVKGKYSESVFKCYKSIAAMIEININNEYMNATYRKVHIES